MTSDAQEDNVTKYYVRDWGAMMIGTALMWAGAMIIAAGLAINTDRIEIRFAGLGFGGILILIGACCIPDAFEERDG